jgi:hypothetical protein
MKKLIAISLCIFSLLWVNVSSAQTWDSLGGGAGTINTPSSVLSLCLYNNNLIAGGAFYSVGNTISAYCIAQWNGSSWNNSPGGEPSGVLSLLVNNGNLIAGTGEYGFLAGTLPGSIYDIIGQWNGSAWNTIGSGIINGHGIGLYSLAEYNGNLCAGGYFFTAEYDNRTYVNLAVWNGTFWDTLPQELSIGPVYAMTVYNGSLYVGGSIYPNENHIAVWNGTNWSVAGTGFNGNVYALAVFNGKLYAGGTFDTAGGVPVNNIAAWDGTSWSPLGNGVNDSVFALASYGSVLIAGGAFTSGGGVQCNKIAQWDGSVWSPLGSGMAGKSVNALCNDSGTLYAGGQFDSAGGIHANNIAQWRSPLAINNLSNDNRPLSLFPNPNNGTFILSLSNSNDKCNVKIFNYLGENIYSAKINSGNTEINLQSQPDGVYFYRAISENGELIGEGKLVVEK